MCVYLAENNINILDIAQTIVDGYFNMMMVVNAEAASKDHDQIAEDLAGIGEELGVQIKAQQEEIAALQTYIDKNMARASTSASAKSRLKILENMEVLEDPEFSERKIRLRFEKTKTHIKMYSRSRI